MATERRLRKLKEIIEAKGLSALLLFEDAFRERLKLMDNTETYLIERSRDE